MERQPLVDSAIESARPWVLPPDAPLLRIPSRPLKYRQSGFEDLYDNTTIFYDCFWIQDGESALLLGPPFLNLKRDIAKMRITAQPSGTLCKFSIRELDRHSQVWVQTPPHTASLAIESSLGNLVLHPAASQAGVFAGRRVLLTLNKNNRIEWICDWVRFHRDVHGADAVLLYDNASTAYSAAELEQHLSALAGIEAVRVVQWPFKYGPQSYFGKHWDSDYCQSGALEDARWKYLQQARSVVNCDIDELVIAPDEKQSIFALTESSKRKYLRFHGKWVVAVDGVENQPAAPGENGQFNRHKDYSYVLSVRREWQKYRFVNKNRCASKWAVVPASCPPKSQWKTHMVAGIFQQPGALDTISYRHFREINTSWKYQRSVRENFDAARHQVDSNLLEAFNRVDWNI